MDDSFDVDKYGSDEFDDSRFIVGSIYICGMDRLGNVVVRYFVPFDAAPVEAIDGGSTVNEGLGDDVFIKSVFEDRQGDVK